MSRTRRAWWWAARSTWRASSPPTIAFHVPRNEALARMEPGAPAAAAAWAAYLRQWTLGNHVRTVAGAAAAAVLADALRVG